jgi:sensor histidine kinase regulating citrate/malate metabolism
MTLSLQIILLVVVFIAIVVFFLYMGGLAIQKTCLKIIAEMEEARAFKEARAVAIQDERKNIFRVGTKNIRPKALNLLIADGLVIKTNNGKYYLDKEKLAQAKAQLNSKNTK